ncbi:tetratricopeptide repeat protein [Leptospira sp. 96542]|nr:tetratricopeptide repeat protein [Leptospira sp. 96542]
MKHVSLFIIVLFLISCQSREFRPVTVSDIASEKADINERQKIEEARQLIASGSNEFQKGNMEAALDKAKTSVSTYELVDGYSLLGASYYQLGDYENAKLGYEKGKNIDPKNEKLLIGLGTVQSTLGENEEALITYQTLSSLKPEETVYAYKVGLILKTLGRYDESLVALKPLEDKQEFPYPIELLNQLGDVCLELKKYDEAERYFAKAEKLNPNLKSATNAKQSTKIASYIQKGNDAISKKKYVEAISEFKKAIELQPNNGSLWAFYGNAQFLNGALGDAESSFKKSISLADTNPNAYLGLCNVYIKSHKYSDCLKTTTNASKKIPKNAELRNKQGICEWKWGEPKKATLSFQDASLWDVHFFEPRLNLAYVLIDQGRFDEALEVIKKAESHPKAKKDELKKVRTLAESQSFITSGDGFLRQGKRKQALEEYGKAMGVSPENPSPHNAFGRAYFAFGENKKSESSYLEALRLDSQNPGAIQGLARLYAKTGESKKEKDYIKRLEKLSTDDPFSAITLGRIAEDAGKWEDAENQYLNLKKKYPDSDAIDFRLGSLYYKRSLEENTKENYKKATEYIQKSRKYTKDIPEAMETEKTISENVRFAEIIPLVKEGNSLFNRKKYLEAAVPYQKAYNKVPKASLLVKVAECYIEKGEEEKGLSILENAVRNNKENATSFKEGIYSFYYKKGELKKAEEGFLELVQNRPDSYYSYYMLGLIAMKRKNYDAAILEFDKSILVNGSFAPSNVGKGLTYYKIGKTEQAKKEFEKARAKDSEFGLSSYNLAIAYFNEDLTNEAKSILESIRKSDPDFMDGEVQLAYIYYKENKLDEAEKIIDAVIKNDDSAEALFAKFRILDAKQKQSPSEINKTKRNQTKEKILKEHGDTKFARLLPSDDMDDAPLHVTDLGLSGTPVSTPILYPNRIIVDYGSALVGFDRLTKEQVWKQYFSSPFQILVAGKELIGFQGEVIVRIFPESGKIAAKREFMLGWVTKEGYATNNGYGFLMENKKTKERKIVFLDPSLEMTSEIVGNDIQTFNISQNQIYVVRDNKKEFILQSFPIGKEKESIKQSTISKRDVKELAKFIGCLAESCLLSVGSNVHSFDYKARTSELGSVGSILSVVNLPESLIIKTPDKFYIWKGSSKWKDSFSADSDFYYPLDSVVLEGKTKEVKLTKGREKISVPWNGDRDGLRISTITVD